MVTFTNYMDSGLILMHGIENKLKDLKTEQVVNI